MADETKPRITVADGAFIVILAILMATGIFYLRAQKTGVIDGMKVMRQLGVENVLARQRATNATRATVKADAMKERFRSELEALNAKLEKTSNPDEKGRIQRQIANRQKEASEAIEAIRQDLQLHYIEDIRRYREALEPVIAKIARKRRIDVVLDSSGGMAIMYANKRVDITDEVLKEMSGKFSAESLFAEQEGAVAMPSASETRELPDNNAVQPKERSGK